MNIGTPRSPRTAPSTATRLLGQPSLILTDPTGRSLLFVQFPGGANDYVTAGNLGAQPASGTIEFWMSPSLISSYPNSFSTNFP